jgi:hypothetical protein
VRCLKRFDMCSRYESIAYSMFNIGGVIIKVWALTDI